MAGASVACTAEGFRTWHESWSCGQPASGLVALQEPLARVCGEAVRRAFHGLVLNCGHSGHMAGFWVVLRTHVATATLARLVARPVPVGELARVVAQLECDSACA